MAATPPPPPRDAAVRSPLRRVLRGVGMALLGLLMLLLLGIGATLTWVHTGGGARVLGRVATDKLRDVLLGQLRVGDIRMRGASTLCLEQVELRDPDGNPALAADAVCAHIATLALIHKKAVVSGVRIEHPVVELATVTGPDGKPTTTVARALAPRHPKPPPPPSQPTDWWVQLTDLALHRGDLRVRPSPGASPTFALEQINIDGAQASYRASGASVGLQVTGEVAAPGRAPVSLGVDAKMDGTDDKAKAQLASLSVKLGQSGFDASGLYDLGSREGELHLRHLRVRPQDLAAVVPPSAPAPAPASKAPAPGEHKRARTATPPVEAHAASPLPLSSEVEGEGDLKLSAGKADLDLRLKAGGGQLHAQASATLEAAPRWTIALLAQSIDPGAVTPLAPRGLINLRVAASGKGTPSFDEHGPKGELSAKIHLGPARLAHLGELSFDLDGSLAGRHGQVRAFSASGLGLRMAAHGAAAYDALALDVRLDAPHLEAVALALAAATQKPPAALSGEAHLVARLTGSVQRPNAQLQLRAPQLELGDKLEAEGLSVDGQLSGKLKEPVGSLSIRAGSLILGAIDLGAPQIEAGVNWPRAHLRIHSNVSRDDDQRGRTRGELSLEGDAEIDEDRDGLMLSRFVASYPQNRLELAHPTRVHLRKETVVEPVALVSPHGSLTVSATLRSANARQPGANDVDLQLKSFDLGHLPAFLFPPDSGLSGIADAEISSRGPSSDPVIDAKIAVRNAAYGTLQGMTLAFSAHAEDQRVRVQGGGTGPAGMKLELKANAPMGNFKKLPAGTKLSAELFVSEVDLARVIQQAQLDALARQRVGGQLQLRIVADGTVGEPKATVGLELSKVRSIWTTQPADARLGLRLDEGKATLDGVVSVVQQPVVSLAGNTELDLRRLLRDKAYLKGALARPVHARVGIDRLPLERLVKVHAIPPEWAGVLDAALTLDGTPLSPRVRLTATGRGISGPRVHALDFQIDGGVDRDLHLAVGGQTGKEGLAHLEARAALSGAELVKLAMRKPDDQAELALLDRPLSLTLQIPGLVLGRVSEMASGGKPAAAEGRLTGELELRGSPARPQLAGRFEIHDIAAGKAALGKADLYLQANHTGALVHLGIDPPAGGNLLAHAALKAPLGARDFLETGVDGLLAGQFDADLRAKNLDLSFLGGLVPNVRRAAGRLDGQMVAAGPLSNPKPHGQLTLQHALFDVVGQGVFHDVGFTATVDPSAAVVDPLYGSLGSGTFSGVLVAMRKDTDKDGTPDTVEFNGELHFGDDASVKGRTNDQGKPLARGPLPLRQAGEDRATLQGEVDLFGDYADGVLDATVSIPDARVDVLKLPDKKLPSLKPNPDVLLVHPGEKPHPPGIEPEELEAEQKARAEARFQLHSHLKLDRLYVKAPDFEFPVTSDLHYDFDAHHPDQPTADGTIEVPNGSFSVLQRRFEIAHAKITETGGEIDDPELDIKANYENAQATVTIQVSGTAKDPQVDLSSTPPMDQDQIAFFLATGHLQGHATENGGGVDLSSAATSVVGGLLFGQLRKSLADVLPVDVLTIETGSSGGPAQASVGKYIGDRVYLGYRQRFANTPYENQSEGRVEYEISRSLTGEATVGDKNSDISVLWTHDF